MSSLYVYAVVEPGAVLPSVRGLAEEDLHVVACGTVAAVVGPMDRAPELAAGALRGHDAVVRALAAGVAALLPARFGTLVAGPVDLRAALEPRGDALRTALQAVRGREQMTLRLSTAEGAPDEPEPAPETAGGAGTRYLAARAGAGLRRRPQVARLLDGLRDLVRAERLEHIDRPPLLGTIYHLVDRGAADGYLARLDALRPQVPGLRLAASGPWPAYAFAEAAEW